MGCIAAQTRGCSTAPCGLLTQPPFLCPPLTKDYHFYSKDFHHHLLQMSLVCDEDAGGDGSGTSVNGLPFVRMGVVVPLFLPERNVDSL